MPFGRHTHTSSHTHIYIYICYDLTASANHSVYSYLWLTGRVYNDERGFVIKLTVG